ncbi:MAG: agmatinase [Acidobacteriota bacterium]
MAPKVALLGVPWDEMSSYRRGAAGAPAVIREAFRCESSNDWSERGIELTAQDVVDAGDVPAASGPAMLAAIESAVSGLLDRRLAPLALGGDHAITYPILRAFARRYPRLSILHFDAHPDLYDEFGGNRYSHACPFARIMEERLASRLVQVGIRTVNRHQREQAARFGVEMIEMRNFRGDFEPAFDGPVYVSFDMDALDPAHAPGVSHREPGGLSTRQAIDLIQRVRAPIVGADVVEFNPGEDVAGLTAMVCGRLVKEIAARILENGQAGAC